MQIKQNIKIVSLIIVLLVLLLTVGDWLALHDIQRDYVSQEMLSTFSLDPSGTLPAWAQATGEWALVTWSVYLRLALLTINTLLALVVMRSDRVRTSS